MIHSSKYFLHLCTLLLVLRSKVIISMVNNVNRNINKFTSVNLSMHARVLYEELTYDGPPTNIDPATSNAPTRYLICEYIINSGLFKGLQLKPVDLHDMYFERKTYPQVYDRLFDSNHNYKNEYTELPFLLFLSPQHIIREYVFVCPVRSLLNNSLVFYYVSKEYNVGPSTEIYMPGRFVFGRIGPHGETLFPQNTVMLAEQPMEIYTKQDFNIELFYLRMRNYVQLAGKKYIDPLCSLLSTDILDPNNQYIRLCMAVCTSDHFRYARNEYSRNQCKKRQVSFRTAKGINESAGKPYYERMTACYCHHTFNIIKTKKLYVSRGYLSNQVLVYQQNSFGNKMFLKFLGTNISIYDHINSFDFVEE